MARLESAEASLRAGGSNPEFFEDWIASRSLSSGARFARPFGSQ